MMCDGCGRDIFPYEEYEFTEKDEILCTDCSKNLKTTEDKK